MANHLQVKVHDKEDFDKARAQIEATSWTGAEKAFHLAAIKAYEQLSATLREKNISIQKLQRLVFGSSTESLERLFDDDLNILPENEEKCDEPQNPESDPEGRTRKPRPKPMGKRNLKLVAGTQIIECKVPDNACGSSCPGCAKGRLLRQAPLTKTCIRTSSLIIVQIFELERLKCGTCSYSSVAEKPKELSECFGKYHPSTIAVLSMLRYVQGMPSNRLKNFTRFTGLEIPDTTQFRLFQFAATSVFPVFKELKRAAANGTLCYRDDTPMRVGELKANIRRQLKEYPNATGDPPVPDAKLRTGIVTTHVVAITKDGHQVALYATGIHHAGEVYGALMSQRKQDDKMIAMADALAANRAHSAADVTVEVGCHVHARRNFVDLKDKYRAEVRTMLELWAALYRNDAETKRRSLGPEERLAFHQAHSMSIIEDMARRTIEGMKKHEPNSSIYDAYRYLDTHWPRLTEFLSLPGVPLDNNEAERGLKVAIRHRKNSLHYRSVEGALVGDVLMSVLQTAIKAGRNPIEYLTGLLLARREARREPVRFLPWASAATDAFAS